MNSLEQLLGIDPNSPGVLRAELLADNDRALLRDLVNVRKSRGLQQATVGRIMGVSQASVSQFEAHDSNPTLATIRRYAHAVGALIAHEVAPDDGQLLDPVRRAQWTTSSMRRLPVPSVAVARKAPQPARDPRNAGAATFRSEMGGSSPADFALAA